MSLFPSLSINTSIFKSQQVEEPVPVDDEDPAFGNVKSSRVSFGIEPNIFSRVGNSFQIITALAGTPFLQAMSNGKDTVVLGDATGVPVAAIERIDTKTFKILSTQGQTPVAQVAPSKDSKVLNVTMEGESEPTYTIHKVVKHPSRQFPTKHVIKKDGEPVAATRYGSGNSYMLSIDAGTEPCLMTCVAAIADEIQA